MLERRAERRIDADLAELSLHDLRRLAWRLFFRFVAEDTEIKPSLRRRLDDELKSHSADPLEGAARSTEYLRSFCLAQMTKHHYAGPLT
jgi:hypothetical protein